MTISKNHSPYVSDRTAILLLKLRESNRKLLNNSFVFFNDLRVKYLRKIDLVDILATISHQYKVFIGQITGVHGDLFQSNITLKP